MKGNSVILLLWKDTSFSLLKLSDPEVNSLNVSRPVSPPSCVALRSHNEPSAQCWNKCSVVFGSLHQAGTLSVCDRLESDFCLCRSTSKPETVKPAIPGRHFGALNKLLQCSALR